MRESVYSSILDGVLLVIVLVCINLSMQDHKETPEQRQQTDSIDKSVLGAYML